LRIFVCEELLKNLEVNMVKIKNSLNQIDEENKEAFYIYNFALFESAICEVIRHILISFPEKMSDKKEVKLKMSDIYSNVFTPNYIIFELVNAEIKSISKGNAKLILEKLESICDIKLNYDDGILQKISSKRNAITHENTQSRQEYILGDRGSNSSEIAIAMVIQDMKYLNNILLDLKLKLEKRFEKYTKYKLIKSLWEDVFKTPLLKFEECVFLRNSYGREDIRVVGFDFEHLKSVATSISSGEKFFLAMLLQQYSGTINDEFFKFKDIPGLVSIRPQYIINEVLQVFNIYPNLFNGINIDVKETDNFK